MGNKADRRDFEDIEAGNKADRRDFEGIEEHSVDDLSRKVDQFKGLRG